MNPELTKKLEAELAEIKNDIVPIRYIKDYLLSACLDNDYLTDMLLTPSRTLSGCAKYVEQQVRQALNNRNGYLPDDEVYGMAEDFYYLTDDEIATLLAPPPVKSKPVQPTMIPVSIQKPKAPPKQDLQLNLFDNPEQQPQEISTYESIEIEDKKITEEESKDYEQEIA